MRILLVSNFYYRRGGDCTYLLALQKLLEAHGHETAVFSMRHPKNLPCPQEPYFVDFLDYAELNRKKNPLAALQVLKRSIWSKQAAQNMARLVTDWKPDLAHFQNIHAYLTPSIFAPLQKAGVPVVWTLHDYKLLCPDSTFLCHGHICEACKGGRFWHCAAKKCKKNSLAASAMATMEALAHRRLNLSQKVARFICPSQFLKQKFVDFGYSAEKFTVLPNFLPETDDLGENTVKNGLWGGENGLKPVDRTQNSYGLYVGSLLPPKGLQTLLKAFAKAPPHPFHVVGAGSERESLENLARELKIDKNVKFFGHLEGQALKNEQSGAAYTVVPSEWYENQPFSIMEALAAGKCVIASDMGGIPELIQSGRTGWLFPAGDVDALAKRIEDVWTHPAEAAVLGKNGMERMKTMYSPEAYFARLMPIYGESQRGEASRGR